MYDKERALLLEVNKANSDQHDKAILQLTGVTLALSVTFVDKIAPNPHPNTYVWLVAGWACLAISMVVMLVSFHTGQLAGDAQINLLARWLETDIRPVTKNYWSQWTTWLNRGSCFLFMAGVIFILVFSGANLPPTGQSEGSQSDPPKGSEVSQSPQMPRPTTAPDPRPGDGHPAPSLPAKPSQPNAPPVKK